MLRQFCTNYNNTLQHQNLAMHALFHYKISFYPCPRTQIWICNANPCMVCYFYYYYHMFFLYKNILKFNIFLKYLCQVKTTCCTCAFGTTMVTATQCKLIKKFEILMFFVSFRIFSVKKICGFRNFCTKCLYGVRLKSTHSYSPSPFRYIMDAYRTFRA